MIEISLGQRIHELRDKANLSLRGLAMRIGISAPFLSDVELGRRFPSEEILAKLADALDVSPTELKQYDTRGPIEDLKRLMDSDLSWALHSEQLCGKDQERRSDCRGYSR
jgi:transcriptional regulator with XRE-family HTH domain